MKRRNLEYALALGGGGTKGAYQVGVIKALKELGIKIVAVSGTSIGAINGAFVLQGDVKLIENIYLNMNFNDICNDEIEVDESRDLLDIKNIVNIIAGYIKNNGLDNSALRELIEKNLDLDKVYNSKMEFGLVTYSTKEKEVVRKFKNEISKSEFVDYILASACFPIFKKQKIGGEEYIDGGIGDVIPINMLIERGYKNIIAVDIEGMGITQNVDNDNTYIKLIYSKEDLGGMFEFDKNRIRRNMTKGYLDTMRSFGKLQGNIYYFENKEFLNMIKLFNLKTIYGIECAAKIYEIDNYKVYKFKDLFELVMKKHNEVLEEYKSINEIIDATKLFHIKKLGDVLDVKFGICLFMDILRMRPTFKNNKIIENNFKEYLYAAEALMELNNEFVV